MRVTVDVNSYQISTEQARRTGDILGIAVVERLDRIVALLQALAVNAPAPAQEETAE